MVELGDTLGLGPSARKGRGSSTLPSGTNQIERRKVTKNKSLIPKGLYCYGYNGVRCPYWSMREDKPEMLNGYCSFLEIGDWMGIDSVDLLWDQVKECEINLGV